MHGNEERPGPEERNASGVLLEWKLDDREARTLLFAPLVRGLPNRPRDIVEIREVLHRLFSDAALADDWVRTPNRDPEFAGARPLDLMLSEKVDGIGVVRRFLERWLESETVETIKPEDRVRGGGLG